MKRLILNLDFCAESAKGSGGIKFCGEIPPLFVEKVMLVAKKSRLTLYPVRFYQQSSYL